MQDKIVILEEGNQTYPRCPQCDMFVLQKSLNGQELATVFCQRGSERKCCCLAEEEARAGTEMSLTAYGVPLALVTSFKYLGRVLVAEDDDWPAVIPNLQHAREKWARLT